MADAMRSEAESAIIAKTKLIQTTLDPLSFPADPEAALQSSESMPVGFCGFNGQYVRASLLLYLMKTLSIDSFIETGTFRGETCLLVAAQTDARIQSCDVVDGHVSFAQRVLAPFGERVQIELQDSRDFLKQKIAEKNLGRPLLYLDAHWFRDLPLIGELEVILAGLEEYIIVIDDFRVPSDNGFGFDSYGRISLEWNLIAPTVLNSARPPSVWYPSYPSKLETGPKRGFVLLTSGEMRNAVSAAVPSSVLCCAHS